MALTREQKTGIISRVKDVVSDSGSVTFVNFHGLSVEDSTEMRKGLREKNVGYFVAKKTLTKHALVDSGISGEIPELSGELAIAYSEGVTDSAREIYEFQKKFEDKISILGGLFEGKFLDKIAMTEIAQIPGMQTLRAQFVNIINSPIQGFAVVLNAIAEKKEA